MGKRHRRKHSKKTQAPPEKVAAFTPALQARLSQWVEESAQVHELDVYDVEMLQQGQWIIRVFVEPPGDYEKGKGVSIEQCALVSRYVEALMDADEEIPERYNIEVSSPGVERKLRKIEHYEKMLGAPATLKLRENIDGQYRVDGTIKAVHAQTVTIEINGEPVEIDLSNIKRANVTFDFDQ